MRKTKHIVLIFTILVLLLIIPNISNAADEISVTRNLYAMDGSMKFTFTGVTIDTTHEYEYGFTETFAKAVEEWYLVTEYTENSVTANIMTGTKQMREVINTVDIGYITIKDITTDEVILNHYEVDLKLPFLKVTSYEVLSHGQNIDGEYNINVPLRNADNSEAYYKYEKITDQNLIDKYKEIKANNGDYTTLESLLKTSVPTSGYSTWGYWNGHSNDGRNGFGYITKNINAPDEGLYYLWVFFSGESIKPLYGCILVDNLQPDIAVDSISLPATKTVELGKTITLYPTFNPSTATNKIVTWTSSDEEVATVDNAGKVTPKKVGSTIITVITQDGNKKATCTVTVVEEEKNISVTGVTLDKSTLSMKVNETYTLKATVAPTNASNKNVTWKSSNEKIAKVSSSGVVTAVAEGKATITVTTADGSKTATCEVTVIKDVKEEEEKDETVVVTGVKLDKTTLTLKVNKTCTLKATVAPTNATNKNVTWKSSNEKVAKVSSSGVVTAVAEGKATITVTTKDGSKTATCEVTVTKDTTISTEKIPQTGVRNGLIFTFVALIGVGVIAFVKYNKLKGI